MILSKGTALPFASQALGETTPTLSNGYFYAQTGLSLAGKFATYAALYRAQPVVATLVDKIANSAARLTMKVWDYTPNAGKVQDTTSPYARLLADPCTFMSPFSFYRWTVSTYEIYGESFWYKVRDPQGPSVTTEYGTRLTGKVVSLLPMHPSRTAVHRTPDGAVEYIFTLGVASAGILHAPAEDVVAFLRYNPDSLMRGLSRLEPLRTTLLNEDAARRATQSFWNKGARPGLFIKHPGELSQAAQDRLKASADARHSGADNFGGTMILEEGMEAQVVQLSMEEMQYIEGRKLNMQEGCMVFDVPPPVVHILDHATFSNITEQMRSMYRDTMSPRLEDWESTIDFALRPDFGPIGQYRATFSLDEVMRGDFEARAIAAVSLVSNGIMKPSEARPLFDLSDAGDVADKLYANAALTELGQNNVTPMDPNQLEGVAANRTPEETAKLIESIGALIRAGFDPASALASIGLDPIKHLGLLPVTLQSAAAGTVSSPTDMLAPPKAKSIQRSLMGFLSNKATTKDLRAGLVAGHQSELDKFFGKQRESVKSAVGKKVAGVFDPNAWDGDLSTILHSLSEATAKAIGAKVAADLGGQYDGGDIADYLTSNAKSTAVQINQTTADQIAKALEAAAEQEMSDEDAVDGLFDGEIAARSNQISLTRVAVIGGLAALVAARLSKAKTKTWVVTSGKPRPSHSAMSGETVELNQLFSNGMNGPGDYSGGADEVAGCSCDLQFSTEG